MEKPITFALLKKCYPEKFQHADSWTASSCVRSAFEGALSTYTIRKLTGVELLDSSLFSMKDTRGMSVLRRFPELKEPLSEMGSHAMLFACPREKNCAFGIADGVAVCVFEDSIQAFFENGEKPEVIAQKPLHMSQYGWFSKRAIPCAAYILDSENKESAISNSWLWLSTEADELENEWRLAYVGADEDPASAAVYDYARNCGRWYATKATLTHIAKEALKKATSEIIENALPYTQAHPEIALGFDNARHIAFQALIEWGHTHPHTESEYTERYGTSASLGPAPWEWERCL